MKVIYCYSFGYTGVTLLKVISKMFLFSDMASLQKNERLSHFHVLNSTVTSACVLSMCITVLIVFQTKDPFSKHEIVGYLIVPFITLLGMIVSFFIWISLKRNTKKKVIKNNELTSLRISNWLSYGFLGLQVSLTLLWIWECQLTLYFLTLDVSYFAPNYTK